MHSLAVRRAALVATRPLSSPRHRQQQQQKQQHLRCYASRKEEEKSWGEIAEDAAEVAKGALKKLGLGALTAVERVLGGKKSSPTSTAQQQRPRPGDEGDGDSFWGPMSRRSDRGRSGPLAGSSSGSNSGGGGLLGSLVGGVLGKAVQGAMGAIAEQQRRAGALADEALDAANADSAVREEFGGALSRSNAGGLGGGGVAQSSSTVVVNGRARRSSSVSFPVAGPRGALGFLEATSVGGGDGEGEEEVVVRVRSQRGKVLVVGSSGSGGGGGGSRGSGGGGGGAAGDVIDVDFREV